MRCAWCGKPADDSKGPVIQNGKLAEHASCTAAREAQGQRAAEQLAAKIGTEWQPVKKWQATLLQKYAVGIEVAEDGKRARRASACHNAAP
jgi:hypothetical protein